MKKLTPVAVAVCLSLAILAVPAGHAQNSKSIGTSATAATLQIQQKQKSTKRKKAKGRLPNYYAQIGISQKQRKTIYDIQSQYRDQIEDLKKQIEDLEAKRNAQVEAVLSPEQKKRLKLVQANAKKRRALKAKKKSGN